MSLVFILIIIICGCTTVSPLGPAALRGDVNEVNALIAKGADVNSQQAGGLTPLMCASQKGHRQVVELLLAKGADVNAKNILGGTALMSACLKGDIEIVELLIEKGADVNAKNNMGGTALMIASFSGNPDVVQLLINRGAVVTTKTNEEWTPLMFASFHGDLETVQVLLDKGIDLNYRTSKGRTAFSVACDGGNVPAALYLYQAGADTTAPDNQFETNARIHHILGDNFLAMDDYGKARISYHKAYGLYSKAAEACKTDVTKLALTQFGAMLLEAALEGAIAGAVGGATHTHTANVNTRLNAQISGMKYAQKTNTSLLGYTKYMNKYNKTYVATSINVNFAPLQPIPANAPLEVKRQFVEMKSKQYEQLSILMKNILECFDMGLNGAELHSCVEAKAR